MATESRPRDYAMDTQASVWRLSTCPFSWAVIATVYSMESEPAFPIQGLEVDQLLEVRLVLIIRKPVSFDKTFGQLPAVQQ